MRLYATSQRIGRNMYLKIDCTDKNGVATVQFQNLKLNRTVNLPEFKDRDLAEKVFADIAWCFDPKHTAR